MSTRILLNRTLVPVFLIVALASCATKKTAYVDMFKLVSEFELQKEYSEQAKRELDRQKAIIDSVVFAEKLKDSVSSEHIKTELYTTWYKKAEEANKQIEAMIWKRLNPYVEEFGKDKGYQFIYGANGTGNVLYADKSLDITEELVKYVNKRYHDKK